MRDRYTPAPWMPGYFRRLMVLVPAHDWPTPDTEEFATYWTEFGRMLALRGASEEQADEAARRLVVEGVRFAGDALHQTAGILREMASEQRRRAGAQAARQAIREAEAEGEREAARLEALWSGLTDAARERWTAEAAHRHPGLDRWPSLLRRLAMGALARATDPAAVEVTTDPDADLWT
jgi:hypothetical protein